MQIIIPLPLGVAASSRLTQTVVSVINTADPNLTPNFKGKSYVEEYQKFFRWTDKEQMSTYIKMDYQDDYICVDVLGHHLEKIL